MEEHSMMVAPGLEGLVRMKQNDVETFHRLVVFLVSRFALFSHPEGWQYAIYAYIQHLSEWSVVLIFNVQCVIHNISLSAVL